MHAAEVDTEITADHLILGCDWLLKCILAPEQRCNARSQMRQAGVFGQIIISAHAQATDSIKIIIARSEKHDGQGFGQ
jgi:hypothetical protein